MSAAKDVSRRAALEDEIEQGEEELRIRSDTTALGDYNLMAEGYEEFRQVLRLRNKKDSKRPKSDIEFVLWKAIETRAGGRLDLKQSGRDQTNQAGLHSVKNCRQVFKALLGMYPPGHQIHQWLAAETKKWERLGDALFDIGCFIKSQRKRSPRVFDEKLLRLWCRWEDAFPGKQFNKFHGLFCTMREYVHVFHMTGRVSEEGGEAFNGVQKRTKSSVGCMPSNRRRINKIAERSQGNLKGDVMRRRLQIKETTTKKKRGTYKARRTDEDHRTIVSVTERGKVVDGEEYTVLQSGNLLLKKWSDMFEWFRGGKAPQDWIDRFQITAPGGFSAIDRLCEENTRVL